jgi:hypothetical protein
MEFKLNDRKNPKGHGALKVYIFICQTCMNTEGKGIFSDIFFNNSTKLNDNVNMMLMIYG